MNIFLLIIIGIAGVVIGRYLGVCRVRRSKVGLIEQQAEEKGDNKEKVLEYFNTHQRATNDEIERLLGVSDATIVRYMDELEKEGRIRQVGDTGSGVYYKKVN
jgi:predicted HTH transcriptional regulator